MFLWSSLIRIKVSQLRLICLEYLLVTEAWHKQPISIASSLITIICEISLLQNVYKIKSVLMKGPRVWDLGIRLLFAKDPKESCTMYKSLLSPKAGIGQISAWGAGSFCPKGRERWQMSHPISPNWQCRSRAFLEERGSSWDLRMTTRSQSLTRPPEVHGGWQVNTLGAGRKPNYGTSVREGGLVRN